MQVGDAKNNYTDMFNVEKSFYSELGILEMTPLCIAWPTLEAEIGGALEGRPFPH